MWPCVDACVTARNQPVSRPEEPWLEEGTCSDRPAGGSVGASVSLSGGLVWIPAGLGGLGQVPSPLLCPLLRKGPPPSSDPWDQCWLRTRTSQSMLGRQDGQRGTLGWIKRTQTIAQLCLPFLLLGRKALKVPALHDLTPTPACIAGHGMKALEILINSRRAPRLWSGLT